MFLKKEGKFLCALLSIFALSFLVYSNSVNNEFIWDDIQIIKENTLIRSYKNVQRILTSNYWDIGSSSRASGNYRPLTILSFLVNYQAGGDNPSGFRLVNIALHSANSSLVFFLALTLGLAARYAFMAAVMFCLHPVHTEPVVWIVGRGELLACFFLLTALLLFITYLKNSKWISFFLSLLMFFCGLLSKESAATLPLLVFGIAVIIGGPQKSGTFRQAFLKTLPYLGVIALYLVIRFSVLGRMEDPDTTFFYGYSLPDRLLTMTKVCSYYWILLFFPVVLRAHYDMMDFPVPTNIFEFPVIMSGCLHLTAFALIGLFYYRRMYLSAFSLLWVYITLLPYMQIIPFQWVLGERFLYIPSVGFSIMFCSLVYSAVSNFSLDSRIEKKLCYPVFVLLFSLFFIRTVDRNTVWANEVVFYKNILKKAPTLAVAHGNLGYAYLSRGDLGNAEKSYRRAIELRPDLKDERRALNYIHSLTGTGVNH